MGNCFASAAIPTFGPETAATPRKEPSLHPIQIIKIIDGDTLECNIYYRLDEIIDATRARLSQRQRSRLIPVQRRCRLYGVDAAEHGTPQGELATKLLTNALHAIPGGKLYARVYPKPEKYGRTLIDICHKDDLTRTINSPWIEVPQDDVGIVMKKYNGGTKALFTRPLPTNK